MRLHIFWNYFDSVERFKTPWKFEDFWRWRYKDYVNEDDTYRGPVRYEFKVSILNELSRYYFGIDCDWTQIRGEKVYYDEEVDAIVDLEYYYGGVYGGGGPDFKLQNLQKIAEDTYLVIYEAWENVGLTEPALTGHVFMTMKASPYGYVIKSCVFGEVERYP